MEIQRYSDSECLDMGIFLREFSKFNIIIYPIKLPDNIDMGNFHRRFIDLMKSQPLIVCNPNNRGIVITPIDD